MENVNLDRKQAYKFIKISEEFSNDSTYSHLGSSVLYQIATLPEPERTKEQTQKSMRTIIQIRLIANGQKSPTAESRWK